MHKFKNFTYILFFSLLGFIFFACANRGQGPQGGPKDETPPRPIKSVPINGSINFIGKKIEIEFDENIMLKDIPNNVIISPPQKVNPDIRAYAKKMNITFNDTLVNDATYSIDFGSAIVDNNESNILKGFVFSFATGNEIDTLQLSGTLINAEDLNPVEGVFVGIHSNLNDSAFTSKAFDRITRSGENGAFTVHNMKKNKFRVYALEDTNRDNIFQDGEGAAFNNEIFETNIEHYMRSDTLWVDSLTIDTIKHVESIRYLPNDVVLKFFKKEFKRQYIAKSERPTPHQLNIFFNTKNDTLPTVRALDLPWDGMHLIQKNNTLDSLTYWLTDSTLIKQDTIRLEVNYLKSDSALNLVPQTDSIRFMMRKAAKAQTTNTTKSNQPEFLRVNNNITNRFDSYKSVVIDFTSPVIKIDTTAFHLSLLVDTVYKPQTFKLEKADSIGMKYYLHHKWIPEESYQLTVDSAAIVDIYGLHNNKLKSDMRVRSLEDYSSLILTFEHYDSAMVVQVMDKADKVVRTVPALTNPTNIEFLEPGEYFLRLFIDRNRNGRWDPGDVKQNLQPEEVFYYSKKLNLIQNWEYEEQWNHILVPILQQKPEEIRKPAGKKK